MGPQDRSSSRVRVVVVAALLVPLTSPLLPSATAGVESAGSQSVARQCIGNVAQAPAPEVVLAPEVLVRGRVDALDVTAAGLAVLDGAGRTITTFSLQGQLQSQVRLGFGVASSLGRVPDGGFLVARGVDELVRLDPLGGVVWTRKLPEQGSNGVFVSASADGATLLGAVTRTGAHYFTLGGDPVGSHASSGVVARGGPRGLITGDGRYVRQYDRAGRLLSTWGASGKENDPMPPAAGLQFYQQGQPVVTDIGVVVPDATMGLRVVTADGLLVGTGPEGEVGGLTERSGAAFLDGWLYYASGKRFSGEQSVSRLRTSDLLASARSARQGAAPRLGFGAGLVTGAPGHYFAPGRRPAVRAVFDPWWSTLGRDLTLRYAVRNRVDVLRNRPVSVRSVALTPSVRRSGASLTLPATPPGAYEVEAALYEGSRRLSRTCLDLMVGASGMRLDLADLPGGFNSGGPTPDRGVALADVLGTGAHREQIHWGTLMPQADGPLDFSSYEAPFRAAAEESRRRGVPFIVQVGEGGPERKLVDAGTWEARVRELVTHFRGVVTHWEAWNEPNTSFGAAEAYVRQVLVPFHRAVDQADPAAVVVGGSVLGVDLPYFRAIGAAGGFDAMDIVAVHPYTGHNRSFEEHGVPAALRELRALMSRSGSGSKELWNTEQAWWSDGPANWHDQADFSSRALVWNRVLGVQRWSYFIAQGSFGPSGITFSVIEDGGQVKPVALALMNTSAQLRGRRFLGMAATGSPNTHVARFGPSATSGTGLLVAWTEDTRLPVRLSAGASTALQLTDVSGAVRSLQVPAAGAPVVLDGSPVFVQVPRGRTVTVTPASPYGRDLTDGGTASATSSNAKNPPAAAIDGVSDTAVRGNYQGAPAWLSAPGDDEPALTVDLVRPVEVGRVLVMSGSVGSISPGLRSYVVELEVGGAWKAVAGEAGQFHDRGRLLTFPAQRATAVRVKVRAVNFGGYSGGARSPFWPRDPAVRSDPNQVWYGPAVVGELSAFGPA